MKEFIMKSILNPEIKNRFVFDAEMEFFTKPQGMTMRYNVLVVDANEIPYTGKVITTLSIKDWCKQNGYTLMVLHSKGPARVNEFTVLE